ncbi:MAG: hypothetical protein PVH11_07445 [Anaerolineae bacterium]|jgi:hypothetical protein
MAEERLRILKMVESGQIGAGEAAELLQALESTEPQGPEPAAEPTVAPSTRPQHRWASFWIYPLMAGIAALMLGSLVLSLVYGAGGAAFWLLCGWFPVLLGLGVVILALWSRRATWMHLRISEAGRRKMTLSFPLPLRLAAWGLRIAQPYVPQLQDTGVDEVVLALRESARQGEPVFIDVQDDEAGEHIELYIG